MSKFLLKLAVVSFFQGIVQIRRRMGFSVIFYYFASVGGDDFTIFQNKLIHRFLKILLLDQYTLVNFRIKPEGSASL